MDIYYFRKWKREYFCRVFQKLEGTDLLLIRFPFKRLLLDQREKILILAILFFHIVKQFRIFLTCLLIVLRWTLGGASKQCFTQAIKTEVFLYN